MQMQGWAEFDRAVEVGRQRAGASWIATSSYATTGQLAFREPPQVPVLQLTERLRYVHLPPADPALLQTPALYVELRRREEPALLRRRFRSVTALGTLARNSGGEPIATYVLYLVADPIRPVLDRAD